MKQKTINLTHISIKHSVKRRIGFTLIELLVVIAIIAILAAIIFPVFTQAKGAAKKTQSIACLKQINLAFNMYTLDNDGVLMRDHINGSDKIYYWWGSWDGSILKPEESYLYPYMKSKGIVVDTIFPNTLRTSLGFTGYGYNYAYLSPSSFDTNWNETSIAVSEASAVSNAETITFATAARINNWEFNPWKLEGSSLIDPPSYEYPSIHARHIGNKSVVSWLDGHVSSVNVSFRKNNFGYGFNSIWYKQEHLGDIIKSGCDFGSPCQDYFYDLN